MNLIIGDEFTPGANRHSMAFRSVSSIMTKALGTRTIVSAVRGALITGKGKLSLAHQIKQFSLAAYDRVFLFYGINDYFHSKANLGVVNQKLTASLQELRRQNHWLKIYGILPFPMYDSKGRSLATQRGMGSYTLHDLNAMLGLVYSNNQVPFLNWSLLANPVVNQHNYQERLKDGKYPKVITTKLMANRIAQFVRRTDQRASQFPGLKMQSATSKNTATEINFFSKSVRDQDTPKSNSSSDVKIKSKHSKK